MATVRRHQSVRFWPEAERSLWVVFNPFQTAMANPVAMQTLVVHLLPNAIGCRLYVGLPTALRFLADGLDAISRDEDE